MELIKPSPNSKYFIREDLFKGLTPEDSYWLGVIMADGCIRVDGNTKKTGFNYKSYKITLAWQSKDLHHLKKFRDYLGDSNRSIVANHSHNSQCYQVNVQGTWLRERVKRYGIIPRKTSEFCEDYTPPIYVNDFIAGWFDGDGYINVGKEDQAFSGCALNVTGEHKSLEWLKDLIIQCGYCGTIRVKPIKDKNASRLHINGRVQCQQFYRLFYNSQLCLPRKWEKFKKIDYDTVRSLSRNRRNGDVQSKSIRRSL
ncbi:MAG: hypothetical protein CMH22_04915 [Methylophaga sp.]|nr:hypothetical protein [Methylophaga sp.]|tara:strand:+ start:48326 stop:49090 length:765 start_codon:yes stop_codon:yes gene_type:complete